MKCLATLGLALTVLCLASNTFAAPPGGDPPGNLAANVAALQEENAAQQEQIDHLVDDLAAETEARANEDSFLQEQIGDEIVARENEDGFLQGQIDLLVGNLAAETEARENEDGFLQEQIGDNEQRILDNQIDIEMLQPADPPCFDTSNRFVDCDNGTVTDTVLGLIWLKDADCFGFGHNWAEGNTLASTLADGQCGLTDNSKAGDWRLPTKEEWEGIVKPSCGYPAFPDKTGWGCYVDEPWTTGIPWANLWSSTPFAPNQAWYVQTNTGNLPGYYKTAPDCRIWPVRNAR